MAKKSMLNLGIVISTPYFKCPESGAYFESPPEGAETIPTNKTNDDGYSYLEISEKCIIMGILITGINGFVGNELREREEGESIALRTGHSSTKGLHPNLKSRGALKNCIHFIVVMKKRKSTVQALKLKSYLLSYDFSST